MREAHELWPKFTLVTHMCVLCREELPSTSRSRVHVIHTQNRWKNPCSRYLMQTETSQKYLFRRFSESCIARMYNQKCCTTFRKAAGLSTSCRMVEISSRQ